jgi:hypothetical protein
MEVYRRSTALEQLMRQVADANGVLARRQAPNQEGGQYVLFRPEGRMIIISKHRDFLTINVRG